MATATNEVERIVRRVLKEEQDETVSAIQELSTLLTEQVIPKLSDGANGKSDWDAGDDAVQDDDANQDDDADQDDAVSMSAFDEEGTTSRRGRPSPDEDDEGDAEDRPEEEIPRAVLDAFTTLYHTLSSEQASALAELFTVVDSEIDDDSNAKDEHNEEARVHA